MPQIQQSTIGTNHSKLSVTITAQDYKPGFDKALKQYGKNISIPGFRKGMVPPGVVKKMHGKSIFIDEVLRLAGQQVDTYLRDNKVKYFAQPLAVQDTTKYNFDMDATEDYIFDFEVGLQPDIEVPLLSNGKVVDAYRVIVTHDMVQEEVERAQYKAGKMSEPESISHDDDVVNINMQECASDGMAIADAPSKPNSLLLKYFTEAGKQLFMGKKVDDVVCLKLSEAIDEKLLPALLRDLDLNVEDAASKDKYFNFSITKVGHVDPAALEVGLFKDVYPNDDINTEEEFRARLGEEIQRYWDGQARNKLHNDLFEILVHETPIDIPVPFLKRWLAEGGEAPKSMEDVEKEWGTFDHQIRWQLISEKLIQDWDIKAEREEIEHAIANQVLQYFAQMGMGNVNANETWVTEVVAKQMKDQKVLSDTYNRIVTDKLFHELESKVKINTKDVSLDEFIAAPRAHHHHH
ncbi:MAG: trigger factor [Bacteroidota bacterium]|jgi:trigger factor